VVLNFGRLIFTGATRDVQDDPTVREAYLGTRAGESGGARAA
jgi:ABC-type branched-subunit amino acid transport system ATPase component